MKKRVLSLLLALVMVVSMLPTMALADTVTAEDGVTLTSLTLARAPQIWYMGATPIPLTFAAETTAYTVDTLPYSGSVDLQVTAAAEEGVTITASINDGEAITLTSGTMATLSGGLVKGKSNVLTVTASSGENSSVYTVTLPVSASFKWKTDLNNGGWYNNAEDVTLSVAVDDSIAETGKSVSYQWYSNTEKSTEGAAAIEGATSAEYTVTKVTEAAELEKAAYYYVVASCEGFDDITSKLHEVTWTEIEKPTELKLKLKVGDTLYDIPHQNWNDVWAWAEQGDSFQLAAVNQDGNETPVIWSGSGYNYTTNENGKLSIIVGSHGQAITYPKATSRFAGGPSKEHALIIDTYNFNSSGASTTLSNDGQREISFGISGGISDHNTWSFSEGYESYARLKTELKGEGTDPDGLSFTALRPGSFTVTFTLGGFEANEVSATKGENFAENNGRTNTTTITITGVAVEDSDGTRTKTYLEMEDGADAPTKQLVAYTENAEDTVTWSSADENVVTVDQNGLITAAGVGSTIVTAKDSAGKTGGIKVVVTSASKPYFENLSFQTGNQGIKSNTLSFAAAKLDYTGVAMSSYSVNNLTLTKDTLFNAEKYTATATYTDWHGNAMVVPINSGAATVLEDMFFETGILTITLADKENAENKTVYTFEMTRPRDTYKQIKSTTGIKLVPNGRELSANLYNNKAEGTMFEAKEDGTLGQYNGVDHRRLYYRTFVQDGLESFALMLDSSTDYAHLRYSTDNGESWTELTQGGDLTGQITFPAREGDTNPEVKVLIQILDDLTYTENLKAGKDGFADSTPAVYTLWVEQLPASGMKMTSASLTHGVSYPAFSTDHYSYNVIVNPEEPAPTLTYTVSEGAVVTVGSAVQTAQEGVYTLELTKNYQSIILTGEKGSATYQFKYSVRTDNRYPDKVLDYLPINSQYTNQAQYGMVPERVLTGGDVFSLGNFGGYATFYYEDAITNDPNNKYGVDFYIYGNSQVDTSTGTPYGFMEPGQVWVSEDGETWYALAGSEHYEDSTLWDYQITYTKTPAGMTSWVDNQGNQDNGKQVGQWPNASNYPLNKLLPAEEITFSGVLIPCVDGSLTGNGQFSGMSKGAKFGYVDVLVNSSDGEDANPYLDNTNYKLPTSGFDLAWAVDTQGTPVDVAGKEFHYIKVVTASNLWAGSANEKSTEIGGVMRTLPQQEAVGQTAAPAGITITDGKSTKTITFSADKQVYEAHLGDMSYVSVKVDGTAAEDNIYINNQYTASGSAAEGILVTREGKLLRVIVQNGDKEPVIYLVKLTSNAAPSLINGVKVEVYGADRLADTTDGVTYKATVGYRIESTKITPVAAAGAVVTINGQPVKDSYPLAEGENIFTIVATKDETTETVTLELTREKAPETNGPITVYFTLLGDENHGDPTGEDDIHTLVGKNLTTWIEKTAYTLNAPATVLDVMEMALTAADMKWVNSGGNYIASINGLAEFDNGWLSGWMYTLNGTHPNKGVLEQAVKNGDSIVFHYTDDYTQEDGSQQFGGAYGSMPEEKFVMPFTDVAEGDYFYEAVKWAVEQEITTGTSETTFSPGLSCTRAQMVTFLWRAAGSPQPTAETTQFTDVKADAYYYTALLWAVEKGITKGTSATTFSPDLTCTRAQMVTFLHRDAGTPAAQASHAFTDVTAAAYYHDAVVWAAAEGITKGTTETTFSPDAVCSRGEAVTFLARYLDNN